jgi:hypothetical protein
MVDPQIQSTQTATTIKKRRWPSILASLFFGIVVPVAIGWYTIYRTEAQAVLAESERARNARASIVGIVEENVINQKVLDISRIARLIELRRSQDRVTSPITVEEVVEEAEFNILNTRYLDFKQKDQYKAVFDELYKDLGSRQFAPFKEGQHADLLNDLAASIEQGKTTEALEKLNRVVGAYQSDIAKVSPQKRVDFFELIFENPVWLISFFVVYLGAGLIYLRWRRGRFRRSLGYRTEK